MRSLFSNILAVILPIAVFGTSPTETNLLTPADKLPKATDSLSFDFSANIQSRHVWRGTLTCSAWNVQPTVNLSKGNFLVGAWAANTFDSSYSEFDLYVSYTIGGFTIALLDYFCPDETLAFNRLFDFNQPTTQHTVDATLTYNGPDQFPITIMASTLIWGDDLDDEGNNYFSTYIEAGYSLKPWVNTQFDLIAGFTTHNGYYAQGANMVNLGLQFEQPLLISDKFTLPIFGKIHVNPYTENIYFVFGFTLGS